ncbi:MAG: GTP-dependent dephospho-CoA kinase family protein [Candidatus Aenigmarchaeota archaeon]|nr:GTP-dependent dephospho-CoA kinase family protein [Candidatus Aenigmarchaeota archaeon]
MYMDFSSDLVLKKECRMLLRVPLGKVVSSPFSLGFSLESEAIVAVGDRTTKNFLERGIIPKLSIVDYKVERRPVENEYAGFREIIAVENPPGKITAPGIDAVSKALSGDKVLLEVDGEEDLLVLPAILLSRTGTLIFYGQPKEGSVFVEVGKESKKKAEYILKTCFSKYVAGK